MGPAARDGEEFVGIDPDGVRPDAGFASFEAQARAGGAGAHAFGRLDEASDVGVGLKAGKRRAEDAADEPLEVRQALGIEHPLEYRHGREGGVQEEADGAIDAAFAKQAGHEGELVVRHPDRLAGGGIGGGRGEGVVHLFIGGPCRARGRLRAREVRREVRERQVDQVEGRPEEAVGGLPVVAVPGVIAEEEAAVAQRPVGRGEDFEPAAVDEVAVEGATAGADPCRSAGAVPARDDGAHGREQPALGRGRCSFRGAGSRHVIDEGAVGQDQTGESLHTASIGVVSPGEARPRWSWNVAAPGERTAACHA
ncbi:MAG: hypothetical protein IPG47_01540 [Thermoflexaceae bacterium]|nr:hypothetical protein [Thermoflexaceae bacterium]